MTPTRTAAVVVTMCFLYSEVEARPRIPTRWAGIAERWRSLTGQTKVNNPQAVQISRGLTSRSDPGRPGFPGKPVVQAPSGNNEPQTIETIFRRWTSRANTLAKAHAQLDLANEMIAQAGSVASRRWGHPAGSMLHVHDVDPFVWMDGKLPESDRKRSRALHDKITNDPEFSRIRQLRARALEHLDRAKQTVRDIDRQDIAGFEQDLNLRSGPGATASPTPAQQIYSALTRVSAASRERRKEIVGLTANSRLEPERREINKLAVGRSAQALVKLRKMESALRLELLDALKPENKSRPLKSNLEELLTAANLGNEKSLLFRISKAIRERKLNPDVLEAAKAGDSEAVEKIVREFPGVHHEASFREQMGLPINRANRDQVAGPRKKAVNQLWESKRQENYKKATDLTAPRTIMAGEGAAHMDWFRSASSFVSMSNHGQVRLAEALAVLRAMPRNSGVKVDRGSIYPQDRLTDRVAHRDIHLLFNLIGRLEQGLSQSQVQELGRAAFDVFEASDAFKTPESHALKRKLANQLEESIGGKLLLSKNAYLIPGLNTLETTIFKTILGLSGAGRGADRTRASDQPRKLLAPKEEVLRLKLVDGVWQ